MLRRLSRREALAALGVGAASLLLAGCGGTTDNAAAPRQTPTPDAVARFAPYTPADEPNGDLAKVVWPTFVRAASAEVQRLYAFQVTNGPLMRYMPCFCGCGADGHRNNRDCYIKAVNLDGSVVFDTMAPT